MNEQGDKQAAWKCKCCKKIYGFQPRSCITTACYYHWSNGKFVDWCELKSVAVSKRIP